MLVVVAKLSVELSQRVTDPTLPVKVRAPELLPKQTLVPPVIEPPVDPLTIVISATPELTMAHEPDCITALYLVVTIMLLKF